MFKLSSNVQGAILGMVAIAGFTAVQAQTPLPPQQLEGLVQRIALYPDPLLAQVLTASTFDRDIPDAARWADQHAFLTGDNLARAIQEDNLPWDPSVIALLPFPSVLDMMARDMGWTQTLANAVLVQRGDVMDAVQRMRRVANDYGYLRATPQYRVIYEGPVISILPIAPGYVYVPFYDPYVVYARPRPGFFVGGAITFGPRIAVGTSFAPWGWRSAPAFGWREHNIVVDNHVWNRTVVNRNNYVHTYNAPPPRFTEPRVERHEVRPVPERHEGRGEERRGEERRGEDRRERR